MLLIVCVIVQGPDAGGAQYTLLGFVEHLGTMRSGHYVAYVQRGMDVSHSPHLQSLLQKHGLAAQSALGSQASSSVSAAPGKKQEKGLGAKAAATDSSSDEPKGVAADNKATARDADTPAFDASTTDDAGAVLDGHNPQGSSMVHMNGKVAEQQRVPNDWEGNGTKSTDNSLVDSPSGPDMGCIDGGSQPSDTVTADTDATSAVASAVRLTSSSDGPAVGQPTPPAKEPDTAQVGSRHQKAAPTFAEDKKVTAQTSWFYISDTQVKMVSEADILSREAYILLYMRTG